MQKALNLFDRALRKGSEIFFLIEELDDPEEAARRLAICHSNDGVCYSAVRDKCIHCKCYMKSKTKMLKHINPKAKGRIEITHCPLAKWAETLADRVEELELVNYYRQIDGNNLLT